MKRTPFAGLTVLEPGDPLTVDGGSFKGRNIESIAQYLERIVTHRHDGAGALGDPGLSPNVAVHSTGGFIPPNTTVYATYTLLDGLGGETAVAPIVSMTTPTGVGTPASAAVGQISYASGSLQVGFYQYVLTLVDVNGGETMPSAPITLERESGHASAVAIINGLSHILGSTFGAVGWRIYRATNGSPYWLIATGSGDDFIDTGLISVVNGTRPPSSDTTNQTTAIAITVPASAVAAASGGFNLYVSGTANFYDPCLFGTYPRASAGTPIAVTSLGAVTEGSPPPVSTTVQGSQEIDASEITNLHWRPPVNTATDLAFGVEGDVRLVLDVGELYGILPPATSAFTSADWTVLSGGGGGEQLGVDETTLEISRNVARVTGTVGVSSGVAGSAAAAFYLPPIYLAAPNSLWFAYKARHAIRASGGTVTFDVRHNGVTIPGLGDVVATNTPTTTSASSNHAVDDEDSIQVVVKSITGQPDGLGVDVYLIADLPEN